ncbi:esterase [Kyrpidia spormannii]|uniref:Esterase n=2 Tax=Kyrpidia spormannii TaxID=2055160 RepID=A0A2K8N710_9BACL|nr:patatin-like phospholipase family protein [Kyrpidia spormannii]ATY85083.1 esterase [Kyrpidia spormannii]CAB3392660.1 putative hydrolase [Kyrpidia spormannii]CAB3393574.1 putative hydrolase [Kyrpidia spormannii]HHY67527.1 patatin family protein [Alicyclobacillus sp.]
MGRPRIGLALGAGSARGFAHIGVLQVLEEHRIPIDLMAGTSMGALVGSLYASGIGPGDLGKLACSLPRRSWVDPAVPKMGLVLGDKITEVIRFLTKGMALEQMSPPLWVVATDLEAGKRVVFRKGPAFRAVRASISIPGIFVPVVSEGRLLVDGGVIERVPVRTAREMGADVVVAVDVGKGQAGPVRHIFDVILQSIDIMERQIVDVRLPEADVVIQPDLGAIGSTAFSQAEVMIERGREAALQMIPRIRELIGSAGGEDGSTAEGA